MGGLGLLLGCLGTDAFLCESDEACQQQGVSGLCQPSGYCSFPDAGCPSGQRYGAHVGGALAYECVEPEQLTAGSGATHDGSATSAGTSTTAGATTLTTSTPPTTGVDGPVTTVPVDGPDTGITSTSGVDDDASGSTTSTGELLCRDDEFDDEMIGAQWCPVTIPGLTVDEPSGHLRFSFEPADWANDGAGTSWLSICEPFPLHGAVATTELVTVPQLSSVTEAFIELGNDDQRLGMGVLAGELYAFEWNGASYAGIIYQPYEPDAHRFLRVVGGDEGFVAESSPDGVGWDHVYTLPAELAGIDGWASLGAWGEAIPPVPDEAQFERFEVCAPTSTL